MTYNHSAFIEDALNGFTMQRTNFPYVCIIVDDASTDGEPEVIKRYLSSHFNLEDKNQVRNEETDDYTLTYAQHNHNKQCFFVVLLLKYNHYKKKAKRPYYREWADKVRYVAMCEGDDYWIDPLKLQKQVDFMERNHEYSICCHNVYLLIDNKIHRKDIPEKIRDKDFSFTNEENLEFWMTETSSILFRNDIYSKISLAKYRYARDTHIVYHLLKLGKGYCFAFYGSVYRHHPGGVYSMTDSFIKQINAYNIYKELHWFNEDDDVLTAFFKHYQLSFFNFLRQIAYEGDVSRKFIKVLRVFSNDIKKENGFRAKLFVNWKILKSYLIGKIQSNR